MFILDPTLIFTTHYDTIEHYIDLNDFIACTKDISIVFNELNLLYFQNSVSIQLVILPVENGSVKKKLGIIATVIGVSWAFVSSDIGKGYVRGLTGHDPEYLAERVGQEQIKVTKLLIDSAKGFMEKDPSEISKVGIQMSNNFKLINAKNDFYEKCINNLGIRGVGFCDSDKFTVPGSAFSSKIDRMGDDEFIYDYKIHELIITAPIVTDDSESQWRAKDKHTGAGIHFHMMDPYFLEGFHEGKYPIKATEKDDEIVVLIEYKTSKLTRKVTQTAKTVFRFNGTQIKQLPDDLSITTLNKIATGLPAEQSDLYE